MEKRERCREEGKDFGLYVRNLFHSSNVTVLFEASPDPPPPSPPPHPSHQCQGPSSILSTSGGDSLYIERNKVPTPVFALEFLLNSEGEHSALFVPPRSSMDLVESTTLSSSFQRNDCLLCSKNTCFGFGFLCTIVMKLFLSNQQCIPYCGIRISI